MDPKARISAALLISLLATGCESDPGSERQAGPAEGPKEGGVGAGSEAPPLPVPRAGEDLLGERLPQDWIERSIGAPVPLSGPTAAPVTLVRFWTDTCPFCEASLPAVEELRERYGADGFATLAVYHPKPPRDVSDQEVEQWAAERGYGGPLAVDRDWSALRRLWLDTGKRPATSFSVLLDADGIVRWVHPGPQFYPHAGGSGAGDENELANADFEDLDRAVRALLAEASARAGTERSGGQ